MNKIIILFQFAEAFIQIDPSKPLATKNVKQEFTCLSFQEGSQELRVRFTLEEGGRLKNFLGETRAHPPYPSWQCILTYVTSQESRSYVTLFNYIGIPEQEYVRDQTHEYIFNILQRISF